MITLTINGISVTVPQGTTVLQACEEVHNEVPRFCYHSRLLVAGNCRMCLVEVAGSPKPVVSCAMPAGPNMKVFTDSPRVKKAREGVMELLLLNHPLDCPICDQGGECDLQDQAMAYGSDISRTTVIRRSVTDKSINPFVTAIMTRCIHCTRCVRFSTEVAGVSALGMTGRGQDAEIGTYIDSLSSSVFSGNVVDLCPVGALTEKPYMFASRPWEETEVDSFDVTDPMGAWVRLKGSLTSPTRAVPRECDLINDEWRTDKGRFSYDAFENLTPFSKDPVDLSNEPHHVYLQESMALNPLTTALPVVSTLSNPQMDSPENYVTTHLPEIESFTKVVLNKFNPMDAPLMDLLLRRMILNGAKGTNVDIYVVSNETYTSTYSLSHISQDQFNRMDLTDTLVLNGDSYHWSTSSPGYVSLSKSPNAVSVAHEGRSTVYRGFSLPFTTGHDDNLYTDGRLVTQFCPDPKENVFPTGQAVYTEQPTFVRNTFNHLQSVGLSSEYDSLDFGSGTQEVVFTPSAVIDGTNSSNHPHHLCATEETYDYWTFGPLAASSDRMRDVSMSLVSHTHAVDLPTTHLHQIN